MMRRALLSLVLLAGLLTPATAQAWGYGWGGWGWGGWGGYRSFYYGPYAGPYYGGWYGYSPYYYSYRPYYYGYGPAYYGYGPAMVYSTPRITTYRSYYGPTDATTPAANGQTVTYFNVHVAPEAEVSFGGAKTTQTGPLRRFVTPPLEPGRRYSYEVTATWTDANGQPATENRTVTFESGRQTEMTVDLRRPANTAQP